MENDYLEARVKAEVKKTYTLFGADPFHDEYNFWPVQTGMGASTLDCLSCVNGRFVAIETKRPGKTWTPRQLIVRDKILTAGGLVYLIDSIEEAKGLLSSLRNQCP